jgi:hypothetical protein
MEKIKAKLTAMPVERPTQEEWIKEFKVGSQGVSLYEALGKINKNDKPNDMMRGYDFKKLKR